MSYEIKMLTTNQFGQFGMWLSDKQSITELLTFLCKSKKSGDSCHYKSNKEFEDFQEWEESDADVEREVASNFGHQLHEGECDFFCDVINA